jgi:uroporphyrinogen-III synthase
MTPRGLDGRVVLVSRPRDQAPPLVRLLEARGATVLVAPTIEILPLPSAELDRALAGLSAGRYEWVSLTSRATVAVLAASLPPPDLRARVAAVGEGTADALAEWSGRRPDLVPAEFETRALAEAFPRGHGRVLCLRADIAPPGLEAALGAKGWTPERVDAYRTRLSRRLDHEVRSALGRGGVDAVTFTSASTVRGFVRALAGPPATTVAGEPKIVCIGPVTAAEARTLGMDVAATADPHTVAGLVRATELAFARS